MNNFPFQNVLFLFCNFFLHTICHRCSLMSGHSYSIYWHHRIIIYNSVSYLTFPNYWALNLFSILCYYKPCYNECPCSSFVDVHLLMFLKKKMVS